MEYMVKPSFRGYLPEPIQKTRQSITSTFLLKLNDIYYVLTVNLGYCLWSNILCLYVVLYLDQSTYYRYKPI